MAQVNVKDEISYTKQQKYGILSIGFMQHSCNSSHNVNTVLSNRHR